MDLQLQLAGYGEILLKPGIPAGYRGPSLKGSDAAFWENELGDIVIQTLAGIGYFIRFSTGTLLEKISASGWFSQYGLYSNFMLKNDVRKELSSIGKFHLRQDQFISYLTDAARSAARFSKPERFSLLEFFYSPALLQELTPFFPGLDQSLTNGEQQILNGSGGWSLPSLSALANQVLDCPFDQQTRQFYYDLKVREILFRVLALTYQQEGKEYVFSNAEIARIHDAKNILESNLAEKMPRVKELAKHVALNEFKLKTGFRKYFHSGIFEWLMNKRMQEAHKLIIETDKPIKEIAALVGYPRTTNFITAFRREFGVTPGALRR
ncbi:MAG: AraC family transcriptional regulator [Ferruginibacter sp.]|nr:AraC family transcriptional regulator [Ferruginibacter sp.]